MEENMLYDQTNNVEHYVGDVINTMPVKQSGIGAWLTSHAVNSMRLNATMQAEHERCRAYLAATGLNYTVTLSNMEATLNQIAPCGQERYKQIVDAYVQESAKRVKEW